MEAHLHLVPPIAHRISLRLPPSFDIDDLADAGIFGLIRAATLYRPRQHGGTPFSAYARPFIAGAIKNSFRRRHWEENTRQPILFEKAPTSRGGSIEGRNSFATEPRSADPSDEYNAAIDRARRLARALWPSEAA